MRWLTRRNRNKPVMGTAAVDTPVQPDGSFCVIGDIHGRMDLLSGALARIAADCPGRPVVFVGDYIDRGPDSAEVLRKLFALHSADPGRFVCLMGNHEDMMLGFLDDTLRDPRIWLQNGAEATLRSFGVSCPSGATAAKGIGQTRAGLAHAMGNDLVAWLRARPLAWQSGNVWVTHAGADPLVDMGRQDRAALLWGHPDFRRIRRSDGRWVVHGHTIVPRVQIADGRVAIDTGAYRTGRLSVVHISGDGIDILA